MLLLCHVVHIQLRGKNGKSAITLMSATHMVIVFMISGERELSPTENGGKVLSNSNHSQSE